MGCGGFICDSFVPSSSTAGGGGGAPASVNPYALPEQWAQNNVVASQTNVALSAQVSTNFDDIVMVRAGSIVGFRTRLTEAVTNGTLTVEITKNGAAFAAPFTLAHTSGSNASGGGVIRAVGGATYVAGDVIGVRITTTGTFTPITTDLEVWVQAAEVL